MKSGFTLIEVLGAIVIMALVVVGSMKALQQVTLTEAKAESHDFLQGLAQSKYQELVATADLTQSSFSGDFSDRGLDDYSYQATLQATGTTSVDSLQVTISNSQDSTQTAEEDGLVFVAPTQTQGTPGTGGAGGGGGDGAGGGGGGGGAQGGGARGGNGNFGGGN